MDQTASDSQAILDAIRRIVRALRLSSKAAELDAGISGAQLFVLRKLCDGQVLSVNELAEQTLTHPSSVSVVISKLAARGLVTRRPSVRDARRMDVAITGKGHVLIEDSPELIQDRLVGSLTAMDNEDRRQLARTLTRLVAAAGFADEAASLFFEDDQPLSPGDQSDGEGGSGNGPTR